MLYSFISSPFSIAEIRDKHRNVGRHYYYIVLNHIISYYTIHVWYKYGQKHRNVGPCAALHLAGVTGVILYYIILYYIIVLYHITYYISNRRHIILHYILFYYYFISYYILWYIVSCYITQMWSLARHYISQEYKALLPYNIVLYYIDVFYNI
jgi:hypothetical protein